MCFCSPRLQNLTDPDAEIIHEIYAPSDWPIEPFVSVEVLHLMNVAHVLVQQR